MFSIFVLLVVALGVAQDGVAQQPVKAPTSAGLVPGGGAFTPSITRPSGEGNKEPEPEVIQVNQVELLDEPGTPGPTRQASQERRAIEQRWAALDRNTTIEAERQIAAARQQAATLVLPPWYRERVSAGRGAVTITVNTLAGDNDGTCGTNGADPVQDCSLLEAVTLANADPAFDVIGFSVAGTISITSPLSINTRIEIDGTTAPGGAHQVEIDASAATVSSVFISGANASNSVIRGLVIGQSGGNGVVILNEAAGVRVVGNYIGTDPAGTDLGNGGAGVSIQNASLNIIGGPAAGEGNVIGFNAALGVSISGEDSIGNRLLGNYIGTDTSGANLGNVGSGVQIRRASFNDVGGEGAGEGNVIGFNGFLATGFAGVAIEAEGAMGNRVLGNYIGTDASGTAMGNGAAGVRIFDVPDNEVGGAAPSEGNTIGFNVGEGVLVEGASATGNALLGNYIGTDVAGGDLGNGLSGVVIQDAPSNTIGAAGAGNVVGFSGEYGVLVDGASATGNLIQGNFVGTDATGANLGNGLNGIRVRLGASDNRIGGSSAGEGNTVGFSVNSGIFMLDAGTSGNVVQGNFVGTNVAGANIGNGGGGVVASAAASDNTIGGAGAGEGNVVGFNRVGIMLQLGATGNVVQGNLVGTDAAGNNLGNVEAGIVIGYEASDNTIGGAAAGEGNRVAFTQSNFIGGIQLQDGGTTGNVVQGNVSTGNDYGLVVGFEVSENLILGNSIGTDAGGNQLGNRSVGILVGTGAFNNSIGGLGEDEGNQVFFTQSGAAQGIQLQQAGTTGNRVQGNIIADNGYGIVVAFGASDSLVQGNFVGTDAAGNDLGNQFTGIFVGINASVNNLVGGPAAAEGNTIGFNGLNGVEIRGAQSAGNAVQGNFIGTDAAGTNMGNGVAGIQINDSPGNTIGGAVAGAGNTIGFNAFNGVWLVGPETTGNRVLGNGIGTDAAGNDIGNGPNGILISDGASNNSIGGPLAGESNTVGLNQENGIRIEGTGTVSNLVQGNYLGTDPAGNDLGNSAAGVLVVGGASDNLIGGAGNGEGNTAGFNFQGVFLGGSGTTGNRVLGNYLGTDAAGNDLGNGVAGALIRDAASGNWIGGTAAGEGNTAGFNDFAGIFLRTEGTSGNVVQGNYAGTNAAGDDLGNAAFGILVDDASDNTIGGTVAGAGNITGFNGFAGIAVRSFGQPTTGNVVQGNYAGTNAAGENLGNGVDGILVDDASDNTIGGTVAGAGNITGFNGFAGITVLSDGPATTGNVVQGNFAGTNAAGDNLGNAGYGIFLQDASDNTIGGAVAGAGNIAGFNGFAGITLLSSGPPTTGNAVQGNYVGTNAAGADLGNPFGIGVFSASDSLIGGTAPGAANRVRFNTKTGIIVGAFPSVAASENISLLGNAVSDNGLLGIDNSIVLDDDDNPDGVTPNDGCGDADSGTNGLQNFPDLLAAARDGAGLTVVDYDLDTAPGDYRVEFFSVLAADPSGHGEGRTFLTAEQVTVTAGCGETFQIDLPEGVPPTVLITATATPLDAGQASGFGGTSEFSEAIAIDFDDELFSDRFEQEVN